MCPGRLESVVEGFVGLVLVVKFITSFWSLLVGPLLNTNLFSMLFNLCYATYKSQGRDVRQPLLKPYQDANRIRREMPDAKPIPKGRISAKDKKQG